MKAATVLAVAASLSAASATLLPRQLEDIPQCALGCAVSSLGSSGCPTSDIACICKAEKFVESLIPCVQGACDAAQFEATKEGAKKLCKSAGVDLVIPDVSGSASSGAASSTGAPSSSSAGTAAPTSSGPAGASSSGSAASSSGPAPTNAPTNASGAGSNNATMTGTRSPTATGQGAPNAAGRNTIAFGGLAAVLGFAVILL
ncbi:hypothetical protein TWF696_009045 [Orbilia brochopaga]|uniref:CFEM domain-containing protein n=1 Tax=Orbilia brochopaga TaxID=3140254 RepID=A0AAV9UI34_9PEZI